MTAWSRIKLERTIGQIEGFSFCIENAKMSGALIDIAEALNSIIEYENKYGGNTNA